MAHNWVYLVPGLSCSSYGSILDLLRLLNLLRRDLAKLFEVEPIELILQLAVARIQSLFRLQSSAVIRNDTFILRSTVPICYCAFWLSIHRRCYQLLASYQAGVGDA